MDVTVTRKEGIMICSVTGEIDLYEAPGFHKQYQSLSSRDSSCHFIIDLEKTTYIDSSGIGVLFQIFTDAKQRKIQFCICNAIGMVEKLFQLSRMTSILPIEKNLSCAIDRIRNSI